MSCTYPGCRHVALMTLKCLEHGGRNYSETDLMKLLAEITGWGRSLVVATSYDEVWKQDQDEHYPTGRWHWSVGTTMCGSGNKSSGHGATLAEALWALVKQVVEDQRSQRDWHQQRIDRATKAIEAFEAR